MPLMNVRSICAIGLRGQLGHNGELPWEGADGHQYRRDVERFFAITRGHVLMAGPRTIAAVPDFARVDRTLVVIRSNDVPEEMIAGYPGRTIFIGGGPPVWDAYAHLIGNWDITRLPYDGPADRWFNPKWLVGSGKMVSER